MYRNKRHMKNGDFEALMKVNIEVRCIMDFNKIYEKGILNLSNSILKYFGAEYTHATLNTLDDILEKEYRNVVLMVFDGLGSANIKELLPEDSFLRLHIVDEINSVYPPTTTAATTTLESGLAPGEHGWLGWSLYFSEVDDNVNIFINTDINGVNVADYNMAGKYIPYKNNIEKINEVKEARAESVSPFGSYKIETMDEMMDAIEKLCKEEGKHYLYSYWPEPDHTMHNMGTTCEEVKELVYKINEEVEKLSKKLKDTLIVVTADHGHIDSKNRYISDYPDILRTLKRLPSIEPRTLAFFVKEGMEEEFKSAFLKHFGETFILFSKQEVIERGVFGGSEFHARFKGFIGDYLAMAIDDIAIFNSLSWYESFKGVHAGLTEREMKVPLIIVECP